MKATDGRLSVLMMIHDAGPGYGGAELLVEDLARRLDKARFRPLVCVTKAPPPDRRELLEETTANLARVGVPLIALQRGSSANPLPWRRVHALLRRERIDVLHTHMLRCNVPGAVLGRLAGVPVSIAHDHVWALSDPVLRRLLNRAVVRPLHDLTLAVCEDNRRRMIAADHVSPDRVRVLYNGLPPRPPPTGADVRTQLGIDARAPLIGAVGRLVPQKAFQDLIEAVAEVRRTVPEVRALIVGEGPERPRLEALVRDRGLEEVVRLTGRRADVPDVLAALDLAVMSSHFEGAPLAVLEFMAAGKALVATRVGGVPELVQDGVHALLVEPQRPDLLAGAITRALTDRALAAALGEAARRRQSTEFTMEAMTARLESLYLELYERALRAGPGRRPHWSRPVVASGENLP